jgi:hypothetical protein
MGRWGNGSMGQWVNGPYRTGTAETNHNQSLSCTSRAPPQLSRSHLFILPTAHCPSRSILVHFQDCQLSTINFPTSPSPLRDEHSRNDQQNSKHFGKAQGFGFRDQCQRQRYDRID